MRVSFSQARLPFRKAKICGNIGIAGGEPLRAFISKNGLRQVSFAKIGIAEVKKHRAGITILREHGLETESAFVIMALGEGAVGVIKRFRARTTGEQDYHACN